MKTTNFLQRCLGIGFVSGTILFGTGFLIRSVQSAQAAVAPAPNEFLAEGTSHIGKYMFLMYNNADDHNRRCGLVWDTETGKSMGYFANGAVWTQENIFPDDPLKE